MKYFRISIAIASIGVMTVFRIPAEAITPAEKIDELNNTIASYTEQIAQKSAEEKNLQNMIDVLDATIGQTQVQIEKTTLEIDQTQNDIEATSKQIEETKRSLDQKTAQLKSLVQELYGLDHKTFLEVLFSKTTLSDLLTQMEYTENVQTRIHTTVTETKELKKQLQQKRTEQEQRRTNLETQKNNQSIYQDSLEGQRAVQEELLQHTTDAESYYQSLLEEVRNEAAAVESSIALSPETHPKLNTDTGVSFIWPIDSRIITCTFHCANYPYDFPHTGLDIATLKGTPVRAVASGYVSRAVWDGTPDLAWVRIEHTPTVATEYLHLSIVSVVPDQYVEQGDILGYSGGLKGDIGSGSYTSGAHLHLTVFQNLVAVDPLRFLP